MNDPADLQNSPAPVVPSVRPGTSESHNPALPTQAAQTDPAAQATQAAPITAQQLRQARWAALALFAALGVFSGAWGAHIPSVKLRYGLSDGEVAGVLLAASAGAVLTLQVAGRWVERLGVRGTCVLAGCGLGVLLGAVLLWPGWGALLPAMVLIGALGALYDVAINAEGTTLESLGGRAVMGQLHGLFSLGGMAGALLSAALLRAQVPAALQLGGTGLLVLALVLVAQRGLLPQRVHQSAAEPEPDAPPAAPTGPSATPRWRRPHGTLVLIGLLILTGMMAEGVMYDWSVLYLHDVLALPQDRAALAYAVFSAAMAGTRLVGDALRERHAQATLLRGGAGLAGGAMLVVLVLGNAWVALVGFALVGMGLALVVPMLYKAATLVPGVPRARAIAAVSSIGYAGFLLGPPLIGGLAQWLNLTAAMGVVVLGCAALAAGARRV